MKMTVEELIEELKEFPNDYNITINREYFDDGDYSYGWHTEKYDDICTLHQDDKNKEIQITLIN